MSRTSIGRILRSDLQRAALPPLSDVESDAYLYETVTDLPDAQLMALAQGLQHLDRTGCQKPIVRSLVSRAVRLIECDLILSRWE